MHIINYLSFVASHICRFSTWFNSSAFYKHGKMMKNKQLLKCLHSGQLFSVLNGLGLYTDAEIRRSVGMADAWVKRKYPTLKVYRGSLSVLTSIPLNINMMLKFLPKAYVVRTWH